MLEASLRDFEQRNAHLAGTIATLRADVAERDATLASRPTEEAVRRAQEEASVQRATVESLKAEAAASLNVRRELEERLAAERTSWADQRGTAEALRREEENGHADVVRLLLSLPVERGADPAADDNSVLDFIAKYGPTDIVKALLVRSGQSMKYARAPGIWSSARGPTKRSMSSIPPFVVCTGPWPTRRRANRPGL